MSLFDWALGSLRVKQDFVSERDLPSPSRSILGFSFSSSGCCVQDSTDKIPRDRRCVSKSPGRRLVMSCFVSSFLNYSKEKLQEIQRDQFVKVAELSVADGFFLHVGAADITQLSCECVASAAF